ncbi:MAG: SH3 domain-containing protein [Anaerolineales bacterium]|jgi:uncharacterized protein YraI|nr:SH3 domain-containing protein [Anaerolineales bacterium]
MQKNYILVLCLSIFLAGCNLPTNSPATATETLRPAASATQTLTPSQTPSPTVTATASITPTPSLMATIQPMTGILINNTNIRARPSKGGSERLGGLFYNQAVKVIGRNERANWYWIIYPDSASGTAWILASAVDLQGEIGLLPIVIFPEDPDKPVAVGPLLPLSTGAALPLNPPGPQARTGVAVQLLNVRVGPGTGYLPLGTIPIGATLSFTGRVEDNSWYQIEYPSGLDGRAWISGELVKLDFGPKLLPLYNFLATPVTEAPPALEEPLATPESGAPPAASATPIPPSATPNLPSGIVTTQINVRSGPASSFESFGLLEANSRVIITGKTLNGNWLQIEYASAPGGRGWAAAAYITLNSDISKLPYFDNQGTPLPAP